MARRKRYSSKTYKGISNLNKASGGKGFSRPRPTVNQDSHDQSDGVPVLKLLVLLAFILLIVYFS